MDKFEKMSQNHKKIEKIVKGKTKEMCPGMFSPQHATRIDPLGPCVLCGNLLKDHQVKKFDEKEEVKLVKLSVGKGRPKLDDDTDPKKMRMRELQLNYYYRNREKCLERMKNYRNGINSKTS
ncbi:MAG TPA: hypothetical protein VK590_02080 [Saprospiraceae bacterium]|nr:hypothetical protein [Saprospiraceae bacterium]